MLMSRFRPFIPRWRYYDLPLFTEKSKLNSVIQSEDQPIHMYQNYKLASSLPASSTTMAGDKQSAIRISPIRTFYNYANLSRDDFRLITLLLSCTK
jgi:hypothetical protein